jgi:hypothetical protein
VVTSLAGEVAGIYPSTGAQMQGLNWVRGEFSKKLEKSFKIPDQL